MKNGHKIVLKWAKENDEAVEKFKRNTRLLAIAMDRILNKTEEKNDDNKMVYSRNERYTRSDRC